MNPPSRSAAAILASALLAASPAAAAPTPRDLLIQASFGDHDKGIALARVTGAERAAASTLAHAPGDHEAQLMAAMATGYHAKLTGSRSEAVTARKRLEAIVAATPNDPEAQLALGAWHVGGVFRLGALGARMALGAQKAAGFAALDRAVALGGDRALFAGLSALLRLELDPGDARGRALAVAAARGTTPTAIDRIMQRAAVQIVATVRAGDDGQIKAVSARLLPFGTVPGLD